MRYLLLIIGVLLLPFGTPNAQPVATAIAVKPVPRVTDAEVIARLKTLDKSVVSPRFTSVVKGYINSYTVRNRERTEAMLGRSALYFPLFEKYLEEKGLPEALKCLPILESALDPTAVSRASAVGLWQFMAATARENGLRINSYVDERKDPHGSTEAALKYLTKLYNKYDDWALALAAYNGGAGRVNRAIRRGGSKDFWRIRRYLPRETRNYVPAFIAALYIWNYYGFHDLEPAYPEVELQMTDVIKIYERVSFSEIGRVTDISTRVIRKLNPSYRRGVIPESTQGYNLILPRRVIATMLNNLDRPDSRHFLESGAIPAPERHRYTASPAAYKYVKLNHWVEKGETLGKIARDYHCTPYNIQVWNNLTGTQIRAGQRLTVYYPQTFKIQEPFEELSRTEAMPVSSRGSNYARDDIEWHLASLDRIFSDKYYFHYLRKRESLENVADKFPGVSLADLIRLNDFGGKRPKRRDRIRLKERENYFQ